MEGMQLYEKEDEYCNSCEESGWTMYIDPPANANLDDYYDNNQHQSYGFYAITNNSDSDDSSVASDASSGPARHQLDYGSADASWALDPAGPNSYGNEGWSGFPWEKRDKSLRRNGANGYGGVKTDMPSSHSRGDCRRSRRSNRQY